MTEREMLPCGMMKPGPTPKNEREGEILDTAICSFWKAAVRLMRLRAAPPSIRMWYSLTLVMVEEITSGSCLAHAMFLGQSEAPNTVNVSSHLWWGTALGMGAAVATTRHNILMMRLDMASKELLYMTWCYLWHSLSLDSESELEWS
jgi:hypothetical protein